MKLRVIVPCYNEMEVLHQTIDKLQSILKENAIHHSYTYDILFVDDGSQDDTLLVLQEASQKHEEIKYISFSRNFGKESAMIAGFEHSVDCDAVVMIDADLQHPPEMILKMIDAYHEGYDQVIAKRTRDGENTSRKWVTRTYYKMINYFVEDIELEDGVGDFRLLSQRAVRSLVSMGEYNRFSKGLFAWIGYNTKTLHYKNVERELGESKWSFGSLFNYAIDGLISFNNKPLRTMIYLGMAIFGVSMIYIIYLLIDTIMHGVSVPGYFTTMAAILFIGGIQLMSIGVVGEYIGRIYYEVKQRPKYIIQEANVAPPLKESVLK
ncbi:glycosyltransferase [Staphylococcus felis]|uniref:Glycosyltransferase n=1 Tax=Staphylococcus felis TaxID=46127 RepID=A0AAX1RU36_9STAP|nr:glycosyltransferase family 2 protein [Staphylococcus felis]MDM8328275.1 glycosyltransferase family 2 protein [Staphylococcus felis]MDQ7193802.1 glycosyltransferase family 2 protein [Staphylococcus felis]REH76939.1 glycosyltransferase [Staphylococcus felis]REH82223.1 glycosyltransferase [Staphylococcus felis]REH82900.1 glycosyltransferase [Staphylococcus felis]